MKTITPLVVVFLSALAVAPAFAQNGAGSPTSSGNPTVASSPVAAPAMNAGQPNESDMMKQMMEMGKLNENHKLLASLDGNWTYHIKFWMNGDPSSKPEESKGTAIRKSIMDGRYVTMDVSGKMKMPSGDGKTMKDVTFKGMGLEGYDNVKKKFVASWIDNMGTSIESSEGTYDPASNSLTYTAEIEPMPGMKQQVREVIKLVDKDHMNLEWYETRGPNEVKTMEIAYTRAK